MAISQQFEAYHEHRVTQELNETRIKNTDSRLKRLAWECDSHRLADLAAEPFRGVAEINRVFALRARLERLLNQ